MRLLVASASVVPRPSCFLHAPLMRRPRASEYLLRPMSRFLSRLGGALLALPLGACLFDSGGSAPRTRFDFAALDGLPHPLARWYEAPSDRGLVSLKFAFRSLDYARDADSNITAFALEAGGLPAIAGAYVDFNVTAARLAAFLEAVDARGVVPYITLDPKQFSNSDVVGQRDFIGRIPQGDFDAVLREAAGVLRDFGKPVLLRFAHEMNGNWYPYSGAFTGGGRDVDRDGVADGPQAYIAAWRYVHGLFTEELGAGATDIAWVYSPNAESFPAAAWNGPYAYYPGSRYVDVIAVDVYEHPEKARRGLAALLDPVYNDLGLFWERHADSTGRIHDSDHALRPFALGEFGTARQGAADKAAWYADALAVLAADARVTFHALYNGRNGSKDFAITGLGASLAQAFSAPRLMFGPLSPRNAPLATDTTFVKRAARR